MCGIAGFSLNADTARVDLDRLTRTMMLAIEHRGRDATGVAWHDRAADQVWIHKHNVRARDFVDHVDLGTANDTRAAIIHTRYGTKGSEQDAVNNHPIEHHGIVGVHNGVLWNDDEVFEALGSPERHGKVDSEAAFALIARGPEELGADPWELFPFLEGSAALAWLDVNDRPGTLHLARVASSPLWVAQTRLGSILFGSTKATVEGAASACGFRIRYINELPEGSYLRVEDGKIVMVRRFDKPDRTAPARKVYYPKARKNRPPAPAPVRSYDPDADEATYSWLTGQGARGGWS